MSGFKFGIASLERLDDVHLNLRKVCNRALDLSDIDFGIVQGLRTEAEQRRLVSEGKSQTMKSKHLTGHAVDFMPYVFSSYQEGWPYYYVVANCFIQASKDLSVPVTWGGAWGVDLWSVRSAQEAQEQYIVRKVRSDRKPFLDGPHFELTDDYQDQPMSA